MSTNLCGQCALTMQRRIQQRENLRHPEPDQHRRRFQGREPLTGAHLLACDQRRPAAHRHLKQGSLLIGEFVPHRARADLQDRLIAYGPAEERAASQRNRHP
jgi:hypothetical protein